jgi:alkylation response protein AidB-like acyl-CoA dehydrogenase
MSDRTAGPPSTEFAGPHFPILLQKLAEWTPELEAADAWPARQFDALADAGVLGWIIPPEWGGSGVSSVELAWGYQQLAQACLCTTFVLTQRNGACERIAGCQNEELKARLLPDLCAGRTFATVGISHLTTSRQHLGRPAVRVRETENGFVFDGSVPWVTGANSADYVVTGGTLDDGRQVLAAIPTLSKGVQIGPSARLMALTASQTGPIELCDVPVEAGDLIAGPVEQVMKHGTGGGAGSLTTSALALGTAAAAIARLLVEAERRPDLLPIHESLAAEHAQTSADLYAAAAGESPQANPALQSESIRQRANSLVLRATQAYLAASKGAGYVSGHPAERAVREALFFLVWSCPQPVLAAALQEFACGLRVDG